MRVLHVFDSSAGWEQGVASGQLLERLDRSNFEQTVAVLDERAVGALRGGIDRAVLRRRRLRSPMLAGPALRGAILRGRIDLVHAWGVDAAAAARAALPVDRPLVISIFDPGIDERSVRVLRTLATYGGFAVICAADRVRRRLVEQGVPMGRCTVIRPGVDFAALREVDKDRLCRELGLSANGPTIVTPDPPSRAAGHMAVLWSALVRRQLDANVRIIIPGLSDELSKLRKLAAASPSSDAVVFTEHRYPFEQLLAVADFLAIAGNGEISMTPVIWAMAASTLVIAPATYAVTEILSHDVNAVLYKPPTSLRRAGVKICALYDPADNFPRLREAARGQAFEVCRLGRCVDQHRRLYENLLNGTTPGEGIVDPALVTL